MNGRDRVILTNGKNCEIDGKIPVCFYLWMSLPVCVCVALKIKILKIKITSQRAIIKSIL